MGMGRGHHPRGSQWPLVTIQRKKPLARSSKPLKRSAVRIKRTAFRAGKRTISREWQQVRRFVEGRANGKCEANTPACPSGAHRGEHVHHIVLRSQGGSDDPSSLLFVCAIAHDFIHKNPAKSYERGWLRRGGSA